MAKIFIINDTSITAGVDSTSDVGSSSIKWVNGYFSGTVTLGTASVSGTITVGTVSASGNVLVGGRVGINVSNPSYNLTSYTTIASKIPSYFDSDGNTRVTVNSPSNGGFLFQIGSSSKFTLAAVDAGGGTEPDLFIYNEVLNSGALVVDGSSNFVGIGTVGPSSRLHVNGTLTVGTVSATGAGIFGGSVTVGTGTIIAAKITASTVSATGQLISAHTAGVVGQLAALTYTFTTDSALQVVSIATPFAGSIDNVYVTTGSVSAVVAQYTVRVGSAGSVAVASVANTTASQGVQESLTTSATTYAITNGLVVTRSAQGTAGDTSICIVVRKTA